MILPALPDFQVWYSSSHFGVVTCGRTSTSAGNRTDAPRSAHPLRPVILAGLGERLSAHAVAVVVSTGPGGQ